MWNILRLTLHCEVFVRLKKLLEKCDRPFFEPIKRCLRKIHHIVSRNVTISGIIMVTTNSKLKNPKCNLNFSVFIFAERWRFRRGFSFYRRSTHFRDGRRSLLAD